MRNRCLIATSSFGVFEQAPLRKLEAAGFELIRNPFGRKLSPHETRNLYAEASVAIAGNEVLDEEVLCRSPHLRVISRCGVGTDNIHLPTTEARRIRVVTTTSPARAVAELTLGLILAAQRHICTADRSLRAGKWQPMYGGLLKDQHAAVIGLGQVGKEVCRLLHGLGMELSGFDPVPDPVFCHQYGVTLLPLHDALRHADVVTIHLPLNTSTRSLFGQEVLACCKPGALLVNTSRGDVVDEEALLWALDSGYLGGAALDVYSREPYRGPFTSLPNVVLTAHMGSYARQARQQMEAEAVDNLLAAWGDLGSVA